VLPESRTKAANRRDCKIALLACFYIKLLKAIEEAVCTNMDFYILRK